ncbi:transporter substrate-binding domain-containing protein [Pararhodospirillum photometricum]|uniref:transporter substrate-binding domain-containing protein n=1 Tax=Pararhodospirillum photometricum TaxID=1084 RepID=UPI0002FFFCB5|nr:transporter substrate-binding domain-containing protein [Pararhodospirillum photometricum]
MKAVILTLSLWVWGLGGATAWADDLDDVLARGELRHLGIYYANFVTGDGDGFDVDLARGFAQSLGVRYTFVQTDFYTVMRDLLGHDSVRRAEDVVQEGSYPVRGDMIAAGFTILPWREKVVLYSEPTFPSQVWLVARADAPQNPIVGSGSLAQDIEATKALIGGHSLLVMERTCLDPANYGLKTKGIDLRAYTKSTNLNEMVPALLNGEADFTLLDVPNAVLDLQKWAGKIKVLGPISEEQALAAAFRPSGARLRDAFNAYLNAIKEEGTYDGLVQKYYASAPRYFPKFFPN